MRNWTAVILTTLGCFGAYGAILAQVTIPNTFTAGAVADPDAVNTNFSTLGSQALNRTGGTMTGTLSSRAIAPSSDATYALGSAALRYTTGAFSGAVTAGSFVGDGSGLTGLDAGDLSAGTLPIARGGTNATGTPTAGGAAYGTGTAYGVTAAGTSGQVLTSNGASAPTWGSVAGVPSGMVMFSSSGSCPSGWAEFTAARGRMIVGLPSGGTNAGTVGTALTNLENKTHSHTIAASGTHTHTGPAHTHEVPSDGWTYGAAGSVATLLVYADDGGPLTFATGTRTTSSSGTGTTSASGDHNHGGATGTSATSDVVAYLQLMACQKS